MKRNWQQDNMAARIAKVLRFEDFYSRRLRDATRAALITEANVVQLGIFHELMRGPCTPTWLSWRLGTDPAYISRTLRLLELERHITTCPSRGDQRRREVQLTDSGRRTARGLKELEERRVRRVLEELPPRQQKRLVSAMDVILEIYERDVLTNLLERTRSVRVDLHAGSM